MPREAGETTTVESKTNFIVPALVGSQVRGETKYSPWPPHDVAANSITDGAGELLALVAQTQLADRDVGARSMGRFPLGTAGATLRPLSSGSSASPLATTGRWR